MICPHCQKEQADGRPDCGSCGIYFEKWKARHTAAATPQTTTPLPPSPVKPKKPSVFHDFMIAGIILGVMVGIGFILGRPECIAIGFIVTVIEIIFRAMGKSAVGRPLILVVILLGGVQFPYIFTPDVLVKERSLQKIHQKLHNFKNRKIKFRAMVESFDYSNVHIGSGQSGKVRVRNGDYWLSVYINSNDVPKPPQKSDFVLVTGWVEKNKQGGHAVVGTELKIINEERPYTEPSQLAALQEALQNPETTEELIIDEAILAEIPHEIKNLTSLKKLTLANCHLEKLGPVLTELSDLEVLDLSNNKLATLPDDFSSLSNLKALSLQSNEFTEIPSVLGELPYLEELNISYNPIKTVGSEVGQLTAMQSLNISNAELSSIDASISYLTDLRTLNLMYNDLESIPTEIDTMGIENVFLRGNPIEKQVQTAYSTKKQQFKKRRR